MVVFIYYRLLVGGLTLVKTRMMELVDMLGLGSSSLFSVRVQVPFLVKSLKNYFLIEILKES